MVTLDQYRDRKLFQVGKTWVRPAFLPSALDEWPDFLEKLLGFWTSCHDGSMHNRN